MSVQKLQFPRPGTEQTLPKLRWKHLRRRHGHTLRWRFAKDPELAHHLAGLEALDTIAPDAVVVLTRQHNGGRFARSFVAHYQAMGADQIVVIDDKSTDGSAELLRDAGAIVLRARSSYTEAHRGRDWFDAVLMHLPKGQPMVVVDIDEYLVFSDGTKTLQDLFAAMDRHRLARLCGIMVDLYPQGPIAEAVFTGADQQMPWEVASGFDGQGYHIRNNWRGPVVTGGVRQRLFDEEVFLSKHPVFRNSGRAIYHAGTIHQAQPFTQNRMPVGAVLLHFKYFSDFVDEHKRIIERGVHYQGARSYRAVLDRLEVAGTPEAFDFRGPCTATYSGPQQLCDLGLMQDLCAG